MVTAGDGITDGAEAASGTHSTVRKERAIGESRILADEAAPVYFATNRTCPILALYADHDFPARAEENEYFVAWMKSLGNQQVTGVKLQDRDHLTIASKIAETGDPARKLIIDFVQGISKSVAAQASSTP